MSRRKHVLQSLEQEVEAPGEGQHIVRAVGSRGSNIIEVEFPDGRSTLCILPAKFHKKLWIKKGNFLVVEDTAEADTRVTGLITAVLFADHVKQLKKMPGVWPPEFDSSSSAASTSQAADQLAALALPDSDSEEGQEAAAGASPSAAAAVSAAAEGGSTAAAGPSGAAEAAAAAGEAAADGEEGEGEGQGEGYYSSSEDDLPPIPKFNNRKVIEYEVSDSESDED